MAAVEARLQLLAVQVSADEDHLGLLALVRGPWLLGRRELDLVVHALEDKLRVALARERDDALGAVEVLLVVLYYAVPVTSEAVESVTLEAASSSA